LNVSTTTVSDQVQALENTLGVRLLNRTTRRVSLTEIGRDYYERCSQILQELAEADEAASALQVTPRGRLRVYCQLGLSGSSRWSPPTFSATTRKSRWICSLATR
jgi:DNA-binding transcriptional LysR family regulator